MLNVLERTPSLVDTKDPSKFSLRKPLQAPRHSTDRVLSGPRSTPLVSSTPVPSSGPLTLSTPTAVRLLPSELTLYSKNPAGKHTVKIPASLPAGEYLLRAEIVSRAARMERSALTLLLSIDCPACGAIIPRCPVLYWYVENAKSFWRVGLNDVL